MITPKDRDAIKDKMYANRFTWRGIQAVSIDLMANFLNSLVSKDKSKYRIAIEVYGEYAEQMAKKYDYVPYPQPFQNWLAQQEEK